MNPPRSVRVAVIVVSFNTQELLRRCLSSIRVADAAGIELHTIVVDNASRDGSPQMVASEFPHVSLFPLPQNTGFTGGNNLALASLGFPAQAPVVAEQPVPSTLRRTYHARNPATHFDANFFSFSSGIGPRGTQRVPAKKSGTLWVSKPPVETGAGSLPGFTRNLSDFAPDYVLLLNSDAELVGDALTEMVEAMHNHPQAGICGPCLRYPDGRFQHSAFRYPGLAQILLDLFPLPWLPGWHRLEASRLNGRYPATQYKGDIPFQVDFVLGAAFLMRGQTIHQIGGLDPAYFMYCEEMDWCLRARRAGWQTYAVPRAIVVHHAGQSSRQMRWSSYARLWRSRLRFYRKYNSVFSPLHTTMARFVIGAGMGIWSLITRRAFRAGRISGTEAGERLAAYAAIRRDCLLRPREADGAVRPFHDRTSDPEISNMHLQREVNL